MKKLAGVLNNNNNTFDLQKLIFMFFMFYCLFFSKVDLKSTWF